MMELRLISYNGRPTPTSGTASVGPAGCTFGRGTDNTLVIQDPDRLVSRNQGRIEPSGTGSGFLLTNVSNANTILLNDREIGPGEHAEVAPGDQIIVGRFALGLFEGLDGTAPSPVPPTAAMTPAAPVVPPAAAPVVSTVDPLAAFDVDLGNASDPFADLLGPAVLPPTPAPAIPKHHVSTPPPPAPIQPAVAQPKPAPVKPVPASATDLFAGLDAPAGDPLPADLGFDAPGLSAASDHWVLNTNPVDLAKPFNPASFIPEDFNPFELPSLASRNTDDPLASLNAGSPITGLEELMKSQDSSPENLLENLPKPSAEPIADNQIHSNGLLGGIGQADPLALFGEESPFSMLDEKKTEVSSMRDNTAEIASAFQMPSIARPAAAQAADDPLADIVASALPPPGTLGHEAIPAPSQQTPSRPVPPKAAPPRPVKPPPPSPEAAKPPAGSVRSAVPAGAPVPSRQTPSQAPSSASQATSTEHLMAAFFSGAGMSEQPAQTLTPEFMRLLGELLATATQGAVDLMQARAATKHELRAEVTMIAPQANNPLKFAPDGQAAMAQLVGKRFAGFMPPTEAMRDAFNDLRAHQVGMTAGMRAALLEVLLRFAPEKLEQRMTQHSLLDSVMPSARKSRLWDLYTDMYQQIKNEAADEFHALCGEAFLRSYDEEVKRLSTRGKQ
jgi:FHA domain-containing protein